MVTAEIGTQLMIRVENRVGMLSEVTHLISKSGINMVAICAYAIDNVAAMMFVTDDNNGARKILEKNGLTVNEEEVVLLSVVNKPGALQLVTDKIAEAGIDMNLMYGSIEKDGKVIRNVIISENNMDVMMIIKTLIERV